MASQKPTSYDFNSNKSKPKQLKIKPIIQRDFKGIGNTLTYTARYKWKIDKALERYKGNKSLNSSTGTNSWL